MDTTATEVDSQSPKDIVKDHVFFKPRGDNGWQSRPEFPTAQELLTRQSELGKLPENPVDKPWASKDEYLRAQYEILRREAVEGLRYSVRYFADGKTRGDNDETCVYTQVRVKEYMMSTIGPIARVSFSTEKSAYKIEWHQSKRLQPGSIVALSPKDDKFKKICKVASIAQRPYRDGLDQDPPLVDLLWADPNDAVLDPNLEMVMIESRSAYFEAARHSLVGLQHAARTNSPIDKYLTGTDTKDKPPTFLMEDPIVDLSSLAHKATEEDSEAVTVLKSHDIITDDMQNLQDLTYLDESQLRGLHRIISKELAVVQGPPGTGKTFTSVEAIKVMVMNRRKHRGPPIIVAAQTNHALDQILTHCIKAGVDVLRLGGRTQSEDIKPRTLFELRRSCSVLPADRECRSVDHRRRENTRQIQNLINTLFGDGILDPDVLLQAGIITEAQHESLTDDSMQTHFAVDVDGPLALWLGENLIPAKILQDRHKTQHEVSEAEVRKNLPEVECEDDEMENIAYDEEDQYRIGGSIIKLQQVWSGKIPSYLSSSKHAVPNALARHDDLFNIDPDLRGAVYQYFQAKLLEVMTPEFAALLVENVNLCKQRKMWRFLGNTQLVRKRKIDIVGCTTTGLTKYRGCLAAILPQSILIEEAAETREANIVSALYPSIQQLILVGDHKQLAPQCDIRYLGNPPYNLNVSLFQRMVNLDMPFVMLKQQRRMKPELRLLLSRFYPDLVDHPIVKSINNRPDVLGMAGRNSWLFDHQWPEDMTTDFSRFNEQEAEMITQFFAYLVCNGTSAAAITVLTFYKGQRKTLLRKLNRHPSLMGSTFKVCTVDSYQGEENEIILLSIVRSPQYGRSYSVGFLTDARRAVVAISRARCGFYVFGNVDNLLQASDESYELWIKIWDAFAEQGRVKRVKGLPIVCQPHHRELWIKDVDDWGDNAGGCDLECKQTRPCGHPCTLKCHAIGHEYLPCSEPCRKILVCEHGCQKLCSQACFCDCKNFQKATQQAQIATRQHMSLEERMIQMGGERSEMLKTSLNHRNASRQRAQTPQASTTATTWERFVKNIDADDQRLNLEQVSATGQQATETLVREVYQPTTLVEGRRVEEGGRAVQQLHLHNNQGSCASALPRPEIASASVPSVQRRLENLMLAVESNSPPRQGNSAVQSTNVQQTQNASLLGGPTLVDTGAPVNTNGNLSTPDHRTIPSITVQPLVPSARTSVVNTTTQPSQPDATSTEPAPSQEQTDDDWLIEL